MLVFHSFSSSTVKARQIISFTLCLLSLTLSSLFSPTFITGLQKVVFTNKQELQTKHTSRQQTLTQIEEEFYMYRRWITVL